MQVDLSDVRQALDSDALVPCFQPIVELRTGRLSGFEVLARWQHPDLGLILPENFISLAEENGMIERLTHQIMRKAFLSASQIPEPLVLTVNISPVQLCDLNLPSKIRRIAEETGLRLDRLMVEITETALVNNLESARKIAVELKALGCRLALDDFGAGYSSLRHLQSLPFNELKVDRSFVETIAYKSQNRKIVAAVVGLAHSLGMVSLAEGIEEEQQADILLWLGCELGQGWLYGYPLPAVRIPEMVAAAPQTLSTRFTAQGDPALSALEALPTLHLSQLQAIYIGAPVGLCFLDKNLRYVSLNQRYADLNGAPIADHVGRTVQEMVPSLLFPRIQPLLLRALQGESIAEQEVSRPSFKPGKPDITVLLYYQPALDEAEAVIGVSVAVVDITDYKKKEEALIEEEEHYRHLFELNPHIPWIADANGNVVEISNRWVQFTGMSKKQSLKMGWLEALHPNDVSHTLKAIRESLHTGKPFHSEYRIKTSDGKWKWMLARGWPRYGPSGEIIRWYGGTEDIGELKELEEALHTSHKRN